MLLEAESKVRKRFRAPHEKVNEHIKSWGCANKLSRHEMHKHAICFHAVAQIVQLSLYAILSFRAIFNHTRYRNTR